MLKETVTRFIGELPVAGNALRWYANQYADGSVVTIQQGHAKSLRWKRYHRYVNGYWIGHYEFPIQAALKEHLKAGDTFFDVGANAGFFTLIASRLVGPKGRCVAFDPSPENASCVAEQILLNGFQNCTVVQEAIADSQGEADFYFATPGSPEGRLGRRQNGEQEIKVKTTTLDDAIRRFGNPTFVKMDIEGGEVPALRGASRLLRETRPSWLIELHGAECERDVREILSDATYDFLDLKGVRVQPGQPLPGHFIAVPLS
jgi:FkbM family methyltransferase